MGVWASIFLIALVPCALATIYFLVLKPVKAAPPETASQRIQTVLWFYAISFMLTAVIWGLVDAYMHGYGDGDLF